MPNRDQQADYPTVSFVIPTLNAEPFLERCLMAIRTQNYPQDKVEIIIADAYSQDRTREIGKRHGAKIIDNPEILHEPGKTLASQHTTGQLLFFTDADNILAHSDWLKQMVEPYRDDPTIKGFLPQTIPPPDSSAVNRYLGYLFTDPLSWFIYGAAANPHDYRQIYRPLKQTENYQIYQFSPADHPLFGMSQGVGMARSFDRGGQGQADDILAGIKLIQEGGKIAYVPTAGVYHYHVESLANFAKKYRWRVRNNLTQKVKGMGMVNRLSYFSQARRLRMYLFIPYGLTLLLPLIDSIRLSLKWGDLVMFWHLPTSFVLGWLIVYEYARKLLGLTKEVGTYGK